MLLGDEVLSLQSFKGVRLALVEGIAVSNVNLRENIERKQTKTKQNKHKLLFQNLLNILSYILIF